ncbi:hypothetical protein BD324DRAFT_615618 [Kockovaella imperatae]|uniref:Uncharacterized protein n=1 Tax=Kockovaella imperatae TaxID=4999 RepID=A0A1Y1UPG1_9TREE|nr:hypothetical protein BD324DRAFT_615618 [Kockovaella imperatae]ORX39950.1 hypothetical protein BD324DRAFT_615618 [Kockovaella imperatae]
MESMVARAYRDSHRKHKLENVQNNVNEASETEDEQDSMMARASFKSPGRIIRKFIHHLEPSRGNQLELGKDGQKHIPMPFDNNPSLSAQQIETLKHPALRFELDASLPPVALEHPVRIWNVVYHSIPPEDRPAMMWKMDQVDDPEDEGKRGHETC